MSHKLSPWHGLKVVKHVQNWCSAVEMLNLHWSYQWKKWYNTKTQWWKKIPTVKSYIKRVVINWNGLHGCSTSFERRLLHLTVFKRSINKSKSIRFQGNKLWQWKTNKNLTINLHYVITLHIHILAGTLRPLPFPQFFFQRETSIEGLSPKKVALKLL